MPTIIVTKTGTGTTHSSVYSTRRFCYYWDGSAWIECIPKYYNGSAWVECDSG